MGRSILNVVSDSGSTTDKLVKVHYHKWSTRTGNDTVREDVMWRTGAFTTTTTDAASQQSKRVGMHVMCEYVHVHRYSTVRER